MTSRAIPEAGPPEPTSATLEGTLALGSALRAPDAHLPPRLTSLPFLGLRGSRSVPGAARGMLPPGLPWTTGLSPREAALLEAWQREPSAPRELPSREEPAPLPEAVGGPLPGFAPPPMSRPLAQLERAAVGTRAPSPLAPMGHPRSAAPTPELPARASLTPAFAERAAAPSSRRPEDSAPLPPLVVGTRAPSPLTPLGPPRSTTPAPELPARASPTPAFAGTSVAPDPRRSMDPGSPPPPPLVVGTRVTSARSDAPTSELPARTSLAPVALEASPSPAPLEASPSLPRLEGPHFPAQTSGPLLPQAVGLAEAVQGLVEGTVSRALEEASRKAPPPPAPPPPAAPPPVDVSSDTFVRGLASRLRALAQEERFRGGLIR